MHHYVLYEQSHCLNILSDLRPAKWKRGLSDVIPTSKGSSDPNVHYVIFDVRTHLRLIENSNWNLAIESGKLWVMRSPPDPLMFAAIFQGRRDNQCCEIVIYA